MLRDISQIVKLYESQIPVITRVDNGAWLFAMDYVVVGVTSNRYITVYHHRSCECIPLWPGMLDNR